MAALQLAILLILKLRWICGEACQLETLKPMKESESHPKIGQGTEREVVQWTGMIFRVFVWQFSVRGRDFCLVFRKNGSVMHLTKKVLENQHVSIVNWKAMLEGSLKHSSVYTHRNASESWVHLLSDYNFDTEIPNRPCSFAHLRYDLWRFSVCLITLPRISYSWPQDQSCFHKSGFWTDFVAERPNRVKLPLCEQANQLMRWQHTGIWSLIPATTRNDRNKKMRVRVCVCYFCVKSSIKLSLKHSTHDSPPT